MKKCTLFNVILHCLNICLFSCAVAQQPQIQFYRQLDMNGMHKIKPLFRIDEKSVHADHFYKITYDSKGRITSVELPDKSNPLVSRKSPYSAILIRYTNDQEIWHFLDADGKTTFGDNGAYVETYAYDKMGFVNRKTNSDLVNNIVKDSLGVVSYLLSADNAGNVTEAIRIGAKGDTVIDSKGQCRTKYIYDDQGNISEQLNLSKNDNLLETVEGIAAIKYKYDSNGNCVEKSYFGKNGELKANSNRMAAKEIFKYDNNGNCIESYLLDENGNYSDLIPGCFILKAQYDEFDRPVGYDFCSQEGIPLQTFKYNANNSSIEVGYWNSDGQRIIDNNEGYSIQYSTYDSMGNMIEENFYNTKRQPISPPYLGYSTIKKRYDTHGNLIENRYYGNNGNLVAEVQSGCAIEEFIYDTRGALIHTVCKDTNGKIISQK